MPTVIAAIPIVLQLISQLAPGFVHLVNWIVSVRAALKQDAAWTPEFEEAFIQALIATKTDPAYQPDQPPMVSNGTAVPIPVTPVPCDCGSNCQ